MCGLRTLKEKILIAWKLKNKINAINNLSVYYAEEAAKISARIISVSPAAFVAFPYFLSPRFFFFFFFLSSIFWRHPRTIVAAFNPIHSHPRKVYSRKNTNNDKNRKHCPTAREKKLARNRNDFLTCIISRSLARRQPLTKNR